MLGSVIVKADQCILFRELVCMTSDEAGGGATKSHRALGMRLRLRETFLKSKIRINS